MKIFTIEIFFFQKIFRLWNLMLTNCVKTNSLQDHNFCWTQSLFLLIYNRYTVYKARLSLYILEKSPEIGFSECYCVADDEMILCLESLTICSFHVNQIMEFSGSQYMVLIAKVYMKLNSLTEWSTSVTAFAYFFSWIIKSLDVCMPGFFW